MSKRKDTMTPERWTRIKTLAAPTGRMIHRSCKAYMQPITNEDGSVSHIPFVQKPGDTYNVGRNADKRERRRYT